MLRAASFSSALVPWCVALAGVVVGNGCAVDAHRAAPAAPPAPTLRELNTTTWVLRSWNLDDPAPAKPEVTLTLKDGKFVGAAGCNHYFAAVKLGEMPGGVTVGLVGATRMMCPPEQMVVEDRFLKQLGGVKKFGFMVGQLALSYELSGVWGVMLFDPRPPSDARRK